MVVERQFQRRAQRVPRLGLGLSVDVYSPDLWDLIRRFEGRAVRPAYLEIFRATATALQAVRQSFPTLPLTYHGEGLWITQPEFGAGPCWEKELDDVASQLRMLRSPWLNHECATKQMGGYSFGTYLPPLYTAESANLVADNITLVQERLDQDASQGDEFGPLFLLEMPPLTYFMAGTIPVPEYFRRICERTACGLVLDIGHLWTVYRYSGAARRLTLEQFVGQFLDAFPMERVIEIHLAGLAAHTSAEVLEGPQPEWIDAHAAPIPAVSWSLLEQVLAHPRLCHLRAVALEVDTKPPELIVEEMASAAMRVGSRITRLLASSSSAPDSRIEPLSSGLGAPRTKVDRRQLEAEYVRYAQIASGRELPTGSAWNAVIEDAAGLGRYVHDYLPHEILHWGGELSDMFPQTCEHLHEQGLSLDAFVPWWFQQPRPVDRPYDFFHLKIDRLLEFVTERAPLLLDLARYEAATLRAAYEDANTSVGSFPEPYR